MYFKDPFTLADHDYRKHCIDLQKNCVHVRKKLQSVAEVIASVSAFCKMMAGCLPVECSFILQVMSFFSAIGICNNE